MGPPGGGGSDLVNPAIMPRVIYTSPPVNWQEPYDEFSGEFSIRFNKAMDLSSIRRALSITDTRGLLTIDTNLVRSQQADIITFFPTEQSGREFRAVDWLVGQEATIAIAPEAMDVNGNHLSARFVMIVKPEPAFRVSTLDIMPRGYGEYNPAVLRLVFNSPVDTDIYHSIVVLPPTSARWVEAEDYTYPYPTHKLYAAIAFVGTDGLFENATYTVVVPSGVQDREGNRLATEFRSSIQTPAFRVYETRPADNARSVSMAPPVANSYSSSGIISVYCTGFIDTGTIRQGFSISPPVRGDFRWPYAKTSQFEYRILESFQPLTRYTVTVGGAFRSRLGSSLVSDHVFSFVTDSFRVVGSTPADGAVGVERGRDIVLTFSAPVDLQSLWTAFQIQPSASGGLYFASYPPDSLSVYYDVASDLQPYTEYTVTISTALRSRWGDPLRSPYAFSFTTGSR
jgi:hypothetical protein